MIDLIPHVGRDGNVYLGWSDSYEIWRIDGPDSLTATVRGCIPPDAMELSVDQSMQGARSLLILSDFMVLEDGTHIVRSGLTDDEGRRIIEVFDSHGTLQESWALNQPHLFHAPATMHAYGPRLQATWLRA
jgi:hypothetical protein